MRRAILLLTCCGCLIICMSCAGNADVIHALAEDKAQYCLSLMTGGTNLNLGRTNTPGSKVTVRPGECILEAPSQP